MKINFQTEADKRIDLYYKELGFGSRSEFSKLIKAGYVTVNGAVVKPVYCLKSDDDLVINLPDTELKPKQLPVEILFEDEDILILNKPSHVAVHPAKSYKGDSLVEWLMFYGCPLSTVGGEDRPGIVHRLDSDTSGAIIVAKNDEVHLLLKEMFQTHSIRKIYNAIANGVPNENSFIIDEPIGRATNPTKMCVRKDGKSAISSVRVIDTCGTYSFLEVEIKTGRTHQIRVHLSHRNLPIIGDSVYGLKKEKINAPRQMLHARHLYFTHPITKKELHVEAQLPDDFKGILCKAGLRELL